MAAKVLDDILSNFLPKETFFEWLSNKSSSDEENIFLNQYECSQVDFVSYFLIFLREQSSRDFQIYDAETPRKNSHSRIVKNSSPSVGKSTPPVRNLQNSSLSGTHLDLESLQSFPSLSSCSSNVESCEKKILETPNDSLSESGNKDNSERKFRRLKLFSETIDKNSKCNNSMKKDLEFIQDPEHVENKFAISTPKPFKNNSVPLMDCFNSSDLQVNFSPRFGSKPRWKNHSLNSSVEINSLTPKSKSYSGDTAYRNKDKFNCRMSLGDFILNDGNDGKKDRKNKTKKKINPIRVSNLSQTSTNSSFSEKTDESIENNYSEKGINRVESETKLEEEKESQTEVKDTTPVKNIESQAEVELVTCAVELQLLSEIYSFLMNENYTQNIMMELCFVISLLVIQDYNKKMSNDADCRSVHLVKEKKLFGNIHNCVYFAVETLWLQRHYLQLLNLSALKLLSENVRIEKFNSKLKEFLMNAYSKRQSAEEIKRHSGLMKTAMQGNVSFQYETDNRENFISDVSFHSFRKQRDLFYNILATWEANHLVSGWIFSIGLGSKIRSLLTTSSDPINLLHLSRLFRNQLIMSCCGENQIEESVNEDILQLIPSADPNKILLLRARLTSSPKRQGPCPLPDFTGHQEFYKDFILCTSHSTFHEHLKNSLCDEILRLNETELTGDIEDDDSCLDEQTQERYLQCTNILRLLAKFLGFIEFLPYRGEKPVSDRILNIHCSVRNSTLPLFDVVGCLNSAIKKQKLTLTIPWLVSYLSMMDSYSAHLKFYQNVWRSLIFIYKRLKTFKYAKTDFYLKLILGWIFQLPNFPSELFYSILDDFNKNSSEPVVSLFGEETKGLDSYDFLQETVLYTVCPFLNEINVILSENLGCAVKHIRPVTTQENSFSKSQASKQIELRLESNFLHNQSSSTRKTVEFVTERVASVVIKHLIHNIVPKIKEGVWVQLESSSIVDEKEAEAESEILAEKCYNEIQKTCAKENWELSCKRSKMALKALLSNDLQGSVADICAKITARQATEKVQRWMQSHITLAMIKKEFLSIVKKKFARKPPDANGSILDASEVANSQKNSHQISNVKRETHDEVVLPPSETLKAIRELIWKMYERDLDALEVGEMIETAIRTIRLRGDVIPAAEKIFLRLLVDLIVIFCVRTQNDVPQEILKKFFHFLKSVESQNLSHSSLERIICPRNVAMIRNDARNKQKAWQNLGNFLMYLMEEEMLTREQIETQLLSLLRLNWEREDAVQYSKFISQILERYIKSNGCDKFSLLLEYMIDTLNDEEPKSESLG